MLRVPVLSEEGKPLSPAKAHRVRPWLKTGKAVVVYNDLDIFPVQLIKCNQNKVLLSNQSPVVAAKHWANYPAFSSIVKSDSSMGLDLTAIPLQVTALPPLPLTLNLGSHAN